MKAVRTLVIIGAVFGLFAAALSAPASALTLNPVCNSLGNECSVVKQDDLSNGSRTKGIINSIIFLAGGLSVIVIMAGAVRYVISRGDPAQVVVAKNTILYAVIGLIVSLLAYAIVQFVVNAF